MVLFCPVRGRALSAFSNMELPFNPEQNLDIPPQSSAQASPGALELLTLFLLGNSPPG